MNNPVNLDTVLHELSQRMGVPISVNQGASIITTHGGDEFWLEAPEESALIVIHTSVFDSIAANASSILQLQNLLQLGSNIPLLRAAWLGIHLDTNTVRMCVTIPKNFVDAATIENIFEHVIRLSDELKKGSLDAATIPQPGNPFLCDTFNAQVLLKELESSADIQASGDHEKSVITTQGGEEFWLETPNDSSLIVIHTGIVPNISAAASTPMALESILKLNTQIDVMKGAWLGIHPSTDTLRLFVAIPKNFIDSSMMQNIFANVSLLNDELQKDHLNLNTSAIASPTASAPPSTAPTFKRPQLGAANRATTGSSSNSAASPSQTPAPAPAPAAAKADSKPQSFDDFRRKLKIR